jgi:hypothetical protein
VVLALRRRSDEMASLQGVLAKAIGGKGQVVGVGGFAVAKSGSAPKIKFGPFNHQHRYVLE